MQPSLTATDLFGSRGRVDVLRVLWGIDAPLTAADVARRARMTHPAAVAVLRWVADSGLAFKSVAGRGYTYWLNRDSVYVRELLEPIFSSERIIPELLLDELRQALEPLTVSVVLFGSYARGSQDLSSDVDVVAVVQGGDERTALENLLATFGVKFRIRFGSELSVIIYDHGEASRLATRAPGLHASLRREGVMVSGLDIDDWTTDTTR